MSTVTDLGPAAGTSLAHGSRRGLRPLVALSLAVIAAVVALGGVALLAWDAQYEGRVLPGVSVGTTSLAGLTRSEAVAVVHAAFPFGGGTLTLDTPDGPLAIPYSTVGRSVDADGLVDEALRAGRGGGLLERAVTEVRQALDGRVLAPRVLLDDLAVAAAVTTAVRSLDRAPVDAAITVGEDMAMHIGRSRTGRTTDPAPTVTAALAALRDPSTPAALTLPVHTARVPPAIDDAAVFAARDGAVRMARPLEITFEDRRWTILPGRIRSWITFEQGPDGAIRPVVDASRVPAVLGKAIVKAVTREPKNAEYLVTRRGTIFGVVASSVGLRLDEAGTTQAIVEALDARAAGGEPGPVTVRSTVIPPKRSTEAAAERAPVMELLGEWRTWFPISERNFFGANIWVPARLINGTVLQPGQRFDWWDAIWPVTAERGFGPGGVIRVDHTEPTGALGGGMCSSSTTLFNAAMRAGLDMRARSNHRYYIDRYPLGLDATVSIIGTSRQTMSFVNDMRTPVFIRGMKVRSGGVGWVVYQLWGTPDGRTVSLSKASVWNVRKATTIYDYTTELPKGERKRLEYPSNGMTTQVTRVVRDRAGRVIHRDTWTSVYRLWNGLILVGV